MKKLLSILILSGLMLNLFAQSNTAEVKIRTSAVCETCKETIEHEMSFAKGVKTVTLDLETKIVKVVYNPAKTNENDIRVALTRVGYDADSLAADPKAFRKLPECCQKPGAH